MPFFEDAFLHALQQDPNDDALRLIYADFLDDRGVPSASAQAELLRVQVQLATLDPISPEAPHLIARQESLLQEWQRVWLGPWADILKGWSFQRGLVEAIQADAADFLDHAEAWFSQWPTLSVVKLMDVGELLPELAGFPWLAHLRGLDLSDNGIPSGDLEELTSSRFVGLLQALDLSGNPIGPLGAASLAQSQALEDLVELHLSRCNLWHEGLVALVSPRAHGCRRWQRLDLSNTGLSRLALIQLVHSPVMKQLESLDLSFNPLDEQGASVLADSSNVQGLLDLGLCQTNTGNREITALARSQNFPRLCSLDLRAHRCSGEYYLNGQAASGIAELARSPLLGQLKRLRLRSRPSSETYPSNGWTARILRPLHPQLPLVRDLENWESDTLRESRYLIPSQLAECDLAEIWWLGDTDQREKPLSHLQRNRFYLEEYPEVLNLLRIVEARVLRMRYGVEEAPMTLAEISAHLNLSLENVLEIERVALAQFIDLLKERKLWW